MAKSLNYYGFDKETYKECLNQIRSTNRKHIFILNTWFLLVNLLYMVFSFLNLFGVTKEQFWFYTLYLILALALDVLIWIFPKSAERHSRAYVYISMALMLSYGIICSVSQPYMPATMFLLVLVLVSLSYIDLMFLMLLIIIAATSVFIVTSFQYKTFSIAYNDVYNASVVLTIAIGLHYMFQRTKMQQFVLYQRDQRIQRELEVKSSFDSLTSLLTRGRFFSIAEEVLRGYDGEEMYLCLLDLDGFKDINDKLGHQMGDKAIQLAGKTIQDVLKIDESEKWSFPERVLREKGNFAGRLGGDEFIAFIRGCSSKDEVFNLIQELLHSLNRVSFSKLSGLSSSIGVTVLKETDLDIDRAYKRADIALYKSKQSGKNQIHFYEDLENGEALK